MTWEDVEVFVAAYREERAAVVEQEQAGLAVLIARVLGREAGR